MRFAMPYPTRVGALALALFAPCALADAAGAAAEEEPGAAGTAGTEERSRPVEVVTVVGERTKLNAEARQRIYDELAKGNKLWADKKIKEAFPHLLRTAEHGFKHSQARVGHIYAHGLGDVGRDTAQAVGWFGVAADGETSRPIKNYFNTIWKRIPEQYVPYFEEVVEDYRTKYGARATGVVCQLRRPAHSHIKRLGCLFQEDLDEHTRDALEDYFDQQARNLIAEQREQQARIDAQERLEQWQRDNEDD